jgi:hypothetical protein
MLCLRNTQSGNLQVLAQWLNILLLSMCIQPFLWGL